MRQQTEFLPNRGNITNRRSKGRAGHTESEWMEYICRDRINPPDIWPGKLPERRGSILIKNRAHLDAFSTATPDPRDILCYYCAMALTAFIKICFVLREKKRSELRCKKPSGLFFVRSVTKPDPFRDKKLRQSFLFDNLLCV